MGRDALGELEAGRTGGPPLRRPRRGPGGHAVTVFIETFAPPPRMLIFGAVDFTAALARVAKVLGYRVTVCDAREVFATTRRFPMADEVVVDWPHRCWSGRATDLGPADAVCVLTHDTKFDVPAPWWPRSAPPSATSGRWAPGGPTQARVERLREAGVTDAGLDRVMAPIGLDIGARTPEETAVSICAEIIARRTGRTAVSLRDSAGPIH